MTQNPFEDIKKEIESEYGTLVSDMKKFFTDNQEQMGAMNQLIIELSNTNSRLMPLRLMWKKTFDSFEENSLKAMSHDKTNFLGLK